MRPPEDPRIPVLQDGEYVNCGKPVVAQGNSRWGSLQAEAGSPCAWLGLPTHTKHDCQGGLKPG